MNLKCVQVLNETTVFEFASLLPIINERKLLVIISEQKHYAQVIDIMD